MKTRNQNFAITQLCELFGVSRFAYYRRESRQSSTPDHNEVVLEMVRIIRQELIGIGTPKLYFLLKPNFEALGIKMGRNKLNELVQNHGLGVKRRKRRYIKTTDSDHGEQTYPHLVRGFEPDAPHQLWVTDITFIPYVRRGFCFLTLITDAYSHKVVGYQLSKTMKAEDCILALYMALTKLPKNHELIHHSDRGSQFISKLYSGLLGDNHIKISMTEDGDPKQNAIAERVNGILKVEMKLGKEHLDYHSASMAVKSTVERYNYLRPHASCDYLTPDEAHQKTGKLTKRWKNYRKEYAIRMKMQNDAEGLRQPPAPPGRFVGHDNEDHPTNGEK